MFKGRNNRPKIMQMRGEDIRQALEHEQQLENQQNNFLIEDVEQEGVPTPQLILQPMEWMNRFETAQTLDDKVKAGQEVQALLAGEGLDQETRNSLQQKAQQLKLNDYMGLYKYSMDLRKVSETAFQSAGGRTPQVERLEPEDQERIHREKQVELQQLKDDTTLDPKALETAKMFAKYLPETDKFVKRQKDPKTHKIEEGTFQTLKDGTRIGKEKGATKVNVFDTDGSLLMRPGTTDDPRKIDMVAKQIQEFLTPGRTEEQNRHLGKRLMQDLQNGSKLIQVNTNEFIARAQSLDEQQMRFIIESGSQQVNEHNRSLDEQNQPKPTKKKGFGLFKKKEKGDKSIGNI